LPFERASFSDIELRDGKVVVQPGNSLWRIARRAYGSGFQYTVIYEANADQIRDPDLIYPGQIFAVPETQPEEEGAQ
jgi:nucleoid-associated protein YgaU